MTKKIKKHNLTNETLLKQFPDSFSLALRAIEIARHMIRSGHSFELAESLEDAAKGDDYVAPPPKERVFEMQPRSGEHAS